MTEENKGRGHNLPHGLPFPEDIIPGDVSVSVDPELKERLDNSLELVRESDETAYLQSSEKNAARLQESVAQVRKGRGMSPHFITMDPVAYFDTSIDHPANVMDIEANVTVTADDLNSQMARMGAKQVMAAELNIALAQAGIAATYTPEMLSAIASGNIRKKQKAKKKTKRK